MFIVWLIFKEIFERKFNAALSGLAMATAVALFVAWSTTELASDRETTRVTRDLGFNLRIIPGNTDMERFWVTGFSDRTMPENTVRQLAQHDRVFLTFNHLVASLQEGFELGGMEIILAGVAPAITAPAQCKQPMGFTIQPGTLYLGFQVAKRLGLSKGQSLEIAGAKFTVARCLAETGTDDDIRVFGLLSDIQAVLKRPGLINEIKAIDCICLAPEQDSLKVIRSELAQMLPGAKVVQVRHLAETRARQRQMVDKYAKFLAPVVLAVCAMWVGTLAALNVRERRPEIGVLRALGRGSVWLASLFLGRAVMMGLVGAVTGYGIGSALALRFGPEIFPVTSGSIHSVHALLVWAVIATPVFAALACFVPAMFALAQDPAVTLREE